MLERYVYAITFGVATLAIAAISLVLAVFAVFNPEALPITLSIVVALLALWTGSLCVDSFQKARAESLQEV